jgi:lysine 2,3-aminomutase
MDENWRDILSASVSTAEGLESHFRRDFRGLRDVIARYPMRINPYYLSLIKNPDGPLGLQAIPDIRELSGDLTNGDPLSEEPQSPVPGLIHRYPDRVVFLVSSACAMYCRYCMRKRNIPDASTVFPVILPEAENRIELGLRYIENTPAVRDVILSGGDPLLLETRVLSEILTRLRRIGHVETIRIHTRVPCTLPFRITRNLVSELKKHHPLYINTHFNHPDEITPQAEEACARLADAGIPLGCQTVLLKGVNDEPSVMAGLMRKLVRIRVKPYYIHHPDPVAGTSHFRPTLETGLAVIQSLRGHISGLCVPHYMIDLPGGKGKLPILSTDIREVSENRIAVTNYLGETCEYTF